MHGSFPNLALTPWRRIWLSSEVWCLVCERGQAWAAAWNWNVSWKDRSRGFYAKRNIGSERSTIYLHRELMLALEPPDDLTLQVDHINGCSLDNRLENLRWVTPAQNRKHVVAKPPSVEQVLAELLEDWRAAPPPEAAALANLGATF